MAQFDVYRVGDQLFLDCQSDALHRLDSRFVVPLIPPERACSPITRLNPRFEIEGEIVAMYTQLASAISRFELRALVASLEAQRDEVIGALDVLITGV